MIKFQHKVRDNVNVVYNTALPVIFGVKKYADSLWAICKERDITVNLQTSLLKIDPGKRQATFERLNSPGETLEQEVRFILYFKVEVIKKDLFVKTHIDNSKC